MASKFGCRAGDIVLLRAEVIGLGSDGPYVRVELGSGGATCFWASTAAVTRIERSFEPQNESPSLSPAVPSNHLMIGMVGS